MTQLSGYLIAAVVVFAALAGWQAHSANQLRIALGEEKQRCETRFEAFSADAERQKSEALEQMRKETQAEKDRLRLERAAQAQELAYLRRMTLSLVDDLERLLIEQERQEPEIVPWLDTPVPLQLLH